MGLRVVRELRRRVADVAAEHQHGRPVLDGHGPSEGRLEGVAVVGDLTEVLGVPPVGLEALDVVVADRQVGVAVDRDVVVVEHDAQVAQAQVTGQRRGLVAQALHEVAVAREHEGVVVDHVGTEAGAQVALGDGHPDRVAEALTERAGRHLDARGAVVGLGVARGVAAPLAERLEVVELEAVPRQVEHGVQEDRRVAARQDEAVAVGPVRVGRVVAHDPAVEHMGGGGQGHRGARMSGAGPARRVHREATDQLDRAGVEVVHGAPWSQRSTVGMDRLTAEPTRPGPPGQPGGRGREQDRAGSNDLFTRSHPSGVPCGALRGCVGGSDVVTGAADGGPTLDGRATAQVTGLRTGPTAGRAGTGPTAGGPKLA